MTDSPFPEGYPLERRGLSVGDVVRLVQLQEWFFNDLPDEVVDFLRACIGQTSKVLSFDDYGHAEIEFLKPGGCHFLWVDPRWLEKV